MSNDNVSYYCGMSGLVIPMPKRDFPPEFQDKSRLAFYASLLNSIEINSSFYKLPMASTVQKWADSVPPNFRFTFKLWRDITHNKGLVFNAEDVDRFMQTIALVGQKRGCLLVQFPPSLTIAHTPQLDQLLNVIKLSDPEQQWKVAVEFRNKSWYQPEVYDLLDAYNATMVLHDLPASAAPIQLGEADFVYLRFHGPNGGYRGSYPDDVLYEYAEYIKEWQADGKTVYVYFNNTMGDAYKNGATLTSFIQPV
jgi:uncharacterized protein YecE (DUF72 family)